MHHPADFQSPVFQFHFVDRHHAPRALRFAHAVETIVAHQLHEVLPALQRVQQLQSKRGCYAAGYIAYEAAPAFDSSMQTHARYSEEPLLYFALFDAPAPTAPESSPEANTNSIHAFNTASWRISDWQPRGTRAAYNQHIAHIHHAIAAGRSYQVNHTIALHSQLQASQAGVHDYYQQMRQEQQAGYCAHLNMGAYQILCASPELFFTFAPTGDGHGGTTGSTTGNTVTTRPMKGTRKRGLWAAQDFALKKALQQSTKDRAENVMIVDLLRNDLGRIANTGSVRVDKLFALEAYPTVWQMTSTISAELPADKTWLDALHALFPCGSVTGTPKVETMRIITDCEPDPRGVYCGSIGLIEPDGYATFNVAIRTVTAHQCASAEQTSNWSLRYHTGGGITWQSTAENEYQEAMTKARFLPDNAQAARAARAETPCCTPDKNGFQLIETLLHNGAQYTLLPRHLHRMEQSAQYFGFAFNRQHALDALYSLPFAFTQTDRQQNNRQNNRQNTTHHRVRLLLHADGRLETSATKLPAPATAPATTPAFATQNQQPRTVLLAQKPIDSNTLWLYHKTTNRSVYDTARQQLKDTEAFDVLLYNQNGELCEFTIGNVVLELAGTRCTPPISSGLLPGTMRAELLETGEITERVLTTADVHSASRIWLVNSVRGWVRVNVCTAIQTSKPSPLLSSVK